MKIRSNIYAIIFVISMPSFMYSSDDSYESDSNPRYSNSRELEIVDDAFRTVSERIMPPYGIFEDDVSSDSDNDEETPLRKRKKISLQSPRYQLKTHSVSLDPAKQFFTEKLMKKYLASKHCHFQCKTGETTPAFVWGNPAYSKELTVERISEIIDHEMISEPEKYWRMQFALVVNPETNDDNEKEKRAAYYRNRMSQNFYMVEKRQRKSKIWEAFSNYFVNFFNENREENKKISTEDIYSLEHTEIYKKFKTLFYQELRRRDPEYKIIPKGWITQKDIVEKGEIEHGNSKKKKRKSEDVDDSDRQIKRADTQKPEDGIGFLLDVAQNQARVTNNQALQTSSQSIQPKRQQTAPIVSDDEDEQLDDEDEIRKAFERDKELGLITQPRLVVQPNQQVVQPRSVQQLEPTQVEQTQVRLPKKHASFPKLKTTPQQIAVINCAQFGTLGQYPQPQLPQFPPINPLYPSAPVRLEQIATACRVLELIQQYKIAVPGYNVPLPRSKKSGSKTKMIPGYDAQVDEQEDSGDETQSEE